MSRYHSCSSECVECPETAYYINLFILKNQLQIQTQFLSKFAIIQSHSTHQVISEHFRFCYMAKERKGTESFSKRVTARYMLYNGLTSVASGRAGEADRCSGWAKVNISHIFPSPLGWLLNLPVIEGERGEGVEWGGGRGINVGLLSIRRNRNELRTTRGDFSKVGGVFLA